MENKEIIDVLNTLVEINNDRIEGYEKASNEAEEAELKDLFERLASTSRANRIELVSEVRQLGGEPEEGTRTSGKFFRAWMDVKAALTGKDRKAILSSCEYGEDAALNTYQKVLENNSEDLLDHQISMIEAQYSMIRSDHDTVRSMRDSLVES